MNKQLEELFHTLNAASEMYEGLEDGAYFQSLRDTVGMYNDNNDTDFDEYDAILDWADWNNEKGEMKR